MSLKAIIDASFITDRTEYDNFMAQYRIDHAACPKCGSLASCQTLVAYVWNKNPEYPYKDLNSATCRDCGCEHKVHDRVKRILELPKEEVDGLVDMLYECLRSINQEHAFKVVSSVDDGDNSSITFKFDVCKIPEEDYIAFVGY